MASEKTIQNRIQCPSCDKKAKRVSAVTLASLLNKESAQLFQTDGHDCCDSNEEGCTPINGDTGWRFCDSEDCDVVYFSEVEDTVFNKSQLNVSVGVKETTGERPLCYCFGHSVSSIKEELNTKGHSDASDDIRAKMKSPGCRCETENPSGSCCLGSVTKGIKIAQDELEMDNAEIDTPATPSGNKGEKIAKIGTIVSAIMASSCCWLPLLLLAVGVSGAGIASTLEAYRPLLIMVTFSFLGAAFYYTYRPKKAAANGGHGCCATEPVGGEDCCAPAAKGKFNIMSLNNLMLWGVTVMALVFLLFPRYVGIIIGGDGKAVSENMNSAVFKIEGMSCEGCTESVSKAISGVTGVSSVKVDFKSGTATVQHLSCCKLPTDAVLSAVKNAGFKGNVVRNHIAKPKPDRKK
ncbi:mercuric transporter MerT family protein [Gimesia aquarii]|uniref:Mercuric transport protein MerT n=1 Tax=Gimesia aquarii TaxID=2527964 RepID=A0A517VWA3_9PLAN|nr:mercuric transporter MerT family protein [Gimesia aquarii]QDT97278.1 Copper-transporting P-type ATPase [Gimesia aquarii]